MGNLRIISRPTMCCDLPLWVLWWCYSNSLTKCSNTGDVYKLIHEGKVSKLGWVMITENCLEVIVDNGKLDNATSDYLIAIRDGFIPIRCDASFDVEPITFIGSIGSSGFASRSPRCFSRILVTEWNHRRMPFTTRRASYALAPCPRASFLVVP